MKYNYMDGKLVKQDSIIRENEEFLLITHFSNSFHHYITVVTAMGYDFILNSYATLNGAKKGHRKWYNFFKKQPIEHIYTFLNTIE